MVERKARVPVGSVRLRAVVEGDLAELFRQQADPESCRMAMVHPRSAASFGEVWAKVIVDPGVTARAVIVDGELVGSVSRFQMDGRDAVGYGIAREHWGRGIATRAVALLLEEVAVRPLYVSVAATNWASIRVLERNGFVEKGRGFMEGTERYVACEVVEMVLE